MNFFTNRSWFCFVGLFFFLPLPSDKEALTFYDSHSGSEQFSLKQEIAC